MRSCFILAIVLLSTTTCLAQVKYELGVEGGLTNTLFQIRDEGSNVGDVGNNLRHVPRRSWAFGVNLRRYGKKISFTKPLCSKQNMPMV